MSENSLDGLIAKVKSEAIDKAEQEAQEIINNAKEKAQRLIKTAEDEKETIINNAQQEADEVVTKGEVALKQAARDVKIAVKNDLLQLYDAVFQANIASSFSPDLYADVVKQVIDKIGEDTKIALPEELSDNVVESIRKQVAEAKVSSEIIKDQRLGSGLSLSKTDEGWTYDISPEAISELMSQHLSQRWLDILNTK